VKSYTVANVETSDVRYEYDALDRRIRRKADTNNNDTVFEVSERRLYDTNPVLSAPSLLPRLGGEGGRKPDEGAFSRVFHELVQTVNEVTGNRTHRFLNGPQPDMVLTDEVFNSSGTPTDILWLLQDHQNSVTDVATMSSTSGQATHRNHLEYNAFGAITSQTNSVYAPLQTYTGQILDTTTGLLFYDARWYDPKLGRFVSEDPIGFAAGDANLRRYVGNSTPNAVDPSGLDENGQQPVGLFEDDPDHTFTHGPKYPSPLAPQATNGTSTDNYATYLKQFPNHISYEVLMQMGATDIILEYVQQGNVFVSRIRLETFTAAQIEEVKKRFENELDGLAVNALTQSLFQKPCRQVVTEELRKRSIDHGKDTIARQLIEHRYRGSGKTYILSKEEVLHLLQFESKSAPRFHVGYNGNGSPNPTEFSERWRKAVEESKAGDPVSYDDETPWLIDNGALAGVTIEFKGTITNGVWTGTVQIRDRFDMNPNWNWVPNSGRTSGGEWRNRSRPGE